MKKILLALLLLSMIPVAQATDVIVHVPVVAVTFVKFFTGIIGLAVVLGMLLMILKYAVSGTDPAEKINTFIRLLVMVALVMSLLVFMVTL
jgi:hypothetical protein